MRQTEGVRLSFASCTIALKGKATRSFHYRASHTNINNHLAVQESEHGENAAHSNDVKSVY